MGLFGGGNTDVVSQTDVFSTSEVTVNPETNVNITTANNTGAIEAGFGSLGLVIDEAGNVLSNGLNSLGRSVGGGVSGAGTNLAFGLLVGVSLLALARAK